MPVKRIKSKLHDVDLVVICNPNNPTGVAYKQSRMVELLNELEKRKISLLIGEAFYDFVQNEPSLMQDVNKFTHLIILRSLTKMYCIPGVRIGYLAGSELMVKKACSSPTDVER